MGSYVRDLGPRLVMVMDKWLAERGSAGKRRPIVPPPSGRAGPILAPANSATSAYGCIGSGSSPSNPWCRRWHRSHAYHLPVDIPLRYITVIGPHSRLCSFHSSYFTRAFDPWTSFLIGGFIVVTSWELFQPLRHATRTLLPHMTTRSPLPSREHMTFTNHRHRARVYLRALAPAPTYLSQSPCQPPIDLFCPRSRLALGSRYAVLPSRRHGRPRLICPRRAMANLHGQERAI